MLFDGPKTISYIENKTTTGNLPIAISFCITMSATIGDKGDTHRRPKDLFVNFLLNIKKWNLTPNPNSKQKFSEKEILDFLDMHSHLLIILSDTNSIGTLMNNETTKSKKINK